MLSRYHVPAFSLALRAKRDNRDTPVKLIFVPNYPRRGREVDFMISASCSAHQRARLMTFRLPQFPHGSDPQGF